MSPRKQKLLAAILIAMLAITAASGAVYAYLSASAGPVENTFTVAPDHTISIQETFTTNAAGNLVKENVCVDVGDPGYAVYVRAAIVVTWKNENGVYSHAPVLDDPTTTETEGDYSLTLNDNAWFKGSDGFYYLETMVEEGETAPLISLCRQNQPGPDGYTLHVEIIAQTIQAKGSTDRLDDDEKPIPAVTDAWGVEVDSNGKLIKPATP